MRKGIESTQRGEKGLFNKRRWANRISTLKGSKRLEPTLCNETNRRAGSLSTTVKRRPCCGSQGKPEQSHEDPVQPGEMKTRKLFRKNRTGLYPLGWKHRGLGFGDFLDMTPKV